MSRRQPLYPLREICDLAKEGHVEFSLSAENDYLDLGFTTAQAKDVVAWLTADEFHHQKHYSDNDITWDVYLAPRRIPGRNEQTLYIKLRLRSTRSGEGVYVTSFHVQRLLADD